MSTSSLEKYLAAMLDEEGIEYVAEYKFHPVRRWRFDIAIPAHKLAIEVQGGIYIHGRHTRGNALEDEYAKINTAVAMGWRVLFATTRLISSGAIVDFVKTIIFCK